MRRREIVWLLLWLAAALLSGAVAPGRARAQDQSPLTLDVRAGYEGAYRIGEWFPVTVEIGNDGPDISAVLEWSFPGQPDEQAFRQEVDLPRGSRKRVMLQVVAQSFTRSGQLRVLAEQNVLASQDLSLDPLDQEVFLAAVVSSNPALLNSLDALQVAGFTSAHVQHLRATDLPDHVAGLRGLSALFLHDLDSAALSPAQRDALDTWVGLGGQLVVSGGVGGQKVAAGLADLLPVQVGGALAQGDLAPLARLAGPDAGALTASAALSQAQPRPAAEQLPPDAPLLFRWRYGAGLVTFSAFDLVSLREWAGEPALWSSVLERQAAPLLGAQLTEVDLLDDVLKLPSLSLPSAGTLLTFLLVYILVIGPLNYILLRSLRRLELAWVTVPLIVLLFAGGLYVAGRALRGGAVQLSQAAVVQGAEGQPRGVATAFIGLFSPGRSTYTVGFPADALVNSPAARASLRDQPAAVVAGPSGARSVALQADVASVSSFAAHSAIDLPISVQSNLISDTAGLSGEVRNAGAGALDDALIVYGNTFARLGSLAPGASKQIARGDLKKSFPRSVDLPEVDQFDRQAMLNALFDRDRARADDGVYLLAWAKQPTIGITVDGQAAAQSGLTLYVVRLASFRNMGR
ncbi:MAG: hypothetical protein IPO81_23350 [Kouleothrix sp.]|nr:hypothetical protein [Kouleothrix sp.]